MKLIPIGWLQCSTSTDFKTGEVFKTSSFFLISSYKHGFWVSKLSRKIKGSLHAKQNYSCHFSLLMLVPENEKRLFSLWFFSCTCVTWLRLELNFLLPCWKPKPWMQIPWWLSTRFLSLIAETPLKIWPHFVAITWQIPLVPKFWWAVCLEVWLVR